MKSIADQKLHLPRHVPLMVLPGAHLFPHLPQPLFIFEPRYRAMLAWSLEHERMFCIAPMKPGITEALTNADFHHIVGLGLIRACVGHEDGTSHLVLQGLARVRLTGFVQDTPFRLAEIQELKTEPCVGPESEEIKEEILGICLQLKEAGFATPEAFDRQLAEVPDLGTFTDIVAHTFLRDAEQCQEVFEERSAALRAQLLIEHLRTLF